MTRWQVLDRYVLTPGGRYKAVTGDDNVKDKVIPPTPLAEWTFSEATAPWQTTAADLPLAQGNTNLATRVATPWGFGINFPSGGSWLQLDAANIGRLHIGGNDGTQVSIAAWVKQTDTDIGFVAGCWQEDNNDPKRQYGLFGDLNLYGGDNRVCMHVSKSGGPTPGYPFSRDYSASKELYSRNVWGFWVGTYDGERIISYLNGLGTDYLSFTDNQGQTYNKNPYIFTEGLNDTPCDFTVGGVKLTGGMSNFLAGQVAKLRIWDVCLTPQEVQALYRAEEALLP